MIDTKTFIETIRDRLTGPLPGREAQFKMAFAHRVEELKNRLNPPDNAKIGCVLISLWEELGVWHTALMRRTDNPRDRHSGQISFPGGRHEAGDGTFAYTALREANEEIGIDPDQAEVLGMLTELYIPVSNFLVYPFVAFLREPPTFHLQPGEVEQVYAPKLAYFQDPASRTTVDVVVGQQYEVKEVPCFMLDERPVWGATAMIIAEFLELID